ncbi:MAG: hypothetical protein ACKODJ_11300, partial [Bacteroidota bacterium]
MTLSVPIQPFWTYQWYNGNVLIGGAVSNAYTASSSGNYSVQIIDELGCRGATQPVGVEVWPNPSPSISPSGNFTICQGTPVVLSVQGVAGSTYQWFFNNNLVSNATSNAFTASQSGSYIVRETSIQGCSSLSSPVQVSVRPIVNTSLAATICQGQGYAFGSQTLAATGTYTRTVPSANGCDSVITLTLTVRPNSSSALSAGICQGQSYVFGTQTLTVAGNYTRTIPAANGCDSVITLGLSVGTANITSITASICFGQTYLFGGNLLSLSGQYSDTISVSGSLCDSIVTLQLTVVGSLSQLITATICQGQSYLFGSQTLTSAGSYTRTIPASNGCDSVITLNLSVRPNSSSVISVTICEGQSYSFGAQILNTPGTYT